MSTNFNLEEHNKKMNDLFKDGKTLSYLANEKPKEEVKYKEVPCSNCQGYGCPTCMGYGVINQLMNTEKKEPEQFIITVKSWRNTDKYPCPKCRKKIGTPYLCEPCNIKIKPVMNF